jgi:hypothetical protein
VALQSENYIFDDDGDDDHDQQRRIATLEKTTLASEEHKRRKTFEWKRIRTHNEIATAIQNFRWNAGEGTERFTRTQNFADKERKEIMCLPT